MTVPGTTKGSYGFRADTVVTSSSPFIRAEHEARDAAHCGAHVEKVTTCARSFLPQGIITVTIRSGCETQGLQPQMIYIRETTTTPPATEGLVTASGAGASFPDAQG